MDTLISWRMRPKHCGYIWVKFRTVNIYKNLIEIMLFMHSFGYISKLKESPILGNGEGGKG